MCYSCLHYSSMIIHIILYLCIFIYWIFSTKYSSMTFNCEVNHFGNCPQFRHLFFLQWRKSFENSKILQISGKPHVVSLPNICYINNVPSQLVTTTRALWQLMHLGTWCTDYDIFLLISYMISFVNIVIWYPFDGALESMCL